MTKGNRTHTDILLVGLLHLRNDGLIRGIDGREGLATDAVAPFVVDKQLVRLEREVDGYS